MPDRGGARQALGMAAGTALSRATGLLRTVALAWALGVTALGDAYNAANTAPNIIFQLAAGGVLTSALVPLLVRQEDERRRAEVASVLLSLTAVVGMAGALLLALGAPAVLRVLTLGARDRPDYDQFLHVGVSWLRMFAPQVALYAVSVFATGVLQARGRLRLAGFAPVATNLVTILAAVTFVGAAGGPAPGIGALGSGPVRILGWGTTVAVAAMAGLQLRGALRAEPGMRLRPRFSDPVVGEVLRLGRWVVVYVAVNQVGYAAVVALASTVVGGLSAYQWAFTVMQLPYAIVAVSVYSAAAPALARSVADGGDVSVRVAEVRRTCFALLVPAATGLAVLSGLFAVSVVGRQGADLVAAGIAGFAASLLPFALFQLLVRTCYAFQDARTPAVVNVVVNLVNVLAAAIVVATLASPAARIAGLAVSHALSYVAGTVVLRRALSRRHAVLLGPIARVTVRPVVASVAMAVVVGPWAVVLGDGAARPGALVAAVALTVAGAIAYVVAARLLGVELPRLRPDRRRGSRA